MSDTREILFDFDGSLDSLVEAINRELTAALVVHTEESPHGNWQVGDGTLEGRPAALTDTSHLDSETTRGHGWMLTLYCHHREGCTDPRSGCTEHAQEVMRKLGASLHSDCVLLYTLQAELDRFLGRHE